MNSSEDRRRPGASALVLAAARVRAEDTANKNNSDRQRISDELESRARAPLATNLSGIGAGGEFVPAETHLSDKPAWRDTVSNPDLVTAEASRARLELADRAGCIEMALDACDTTQASNSLEKMLLHQLAAAHNAAMRLTGRAALHSERACQTGQSDGVGDRHAMEAARAANAAVRLMTAFQQGALTLQRLRTNGQQVVTVQHVQVNEGGQAVVTGSLRAGEGSKGRHRQPRRDHKNGG